MSAVILRRIMRFISSLLLAVLAVCEFKLEASSIGMRFCLWPGPLWVVVFAMSALPLKADIA